MFSKMGTYPAVGLFSRTHIISIVMCFVCIVFAVCLTRKMTAKTYLKLTKILAICFTVTELFKITWSLIHGYNAVNSWVPLYFCSLFIYALWFTYSKNKFINEMGLSFIAFAGIICGTIFIICPSTSFSSYPIYHFQCIYSMVYHSFMVYMGFMIYKTKTLEINMKMVAKYCAFCGIFVTLAVIVNRIFDGNLMFFSSPKGVPLPFLVNIYNFSPLVYTLVMVLAHLSMGAICCGIYKLCTIKHDKILNLEDEEIEKHT